MILRKKQVDIRHFTFTHLYSMYSSQILYTQKPAVSILPQILIQLAYISLIPSHFPKAQITYLRFIFKTRCLGRPFTIIGW